MLDIRNDFPLLSNYNQNGILIYADNAATVQKPQCVLDALQEWYSLRCANTHRGSYKLGALATDIYEHARRIIAEDIGGEEEVIFCRNTTEAINIVSHCFAPAVLKKNDEIAVLISEHHSNLVPWQEIAKAYGCALRYILLDREGRIPEEELIRKINEKTRIVAAAQVSNVLGTRFPIERIIDRAHVFGAFVVIDAAQGYLSYGIDVKKINADFVAFSGHKAFGPEGIGVLWGRYVLLEKMSPLLFGGEMVQNVSWDSTSFEKPPFRFEAGTQNAAGAFAFSAAVQYVSSLGRENISSHDGELTRKLLDGMREIPGIRIYGNGSWASDRAGIVSFNFSGQEPLLISRYLDSRGITVRIGTLCAQPLMEYMGTNGVCRISFAPYNTKNEVDYILETLREIPERILKTALQRKK